MQPFILRREGTYLIREIKQFVHHFIHEVKEIKFY